MQARAIVALITPFDEKGQVDLETLENLILWHAHEGTEGLVLCGSTGEGALLSLEEKLAIFQKAVEVGKGKIALIANTGTCQTNQSVSLTQAVKEMGYDVALAIVPYYVKPTEAGCLHHFRAIANVGLPLIAYHHPGRTGTTLSIETLIEISKIPGVIGIKQVSDDWEASLKLCKEGVRLYSGDDGLALAQFASGFIGSISIVGNVIPRKWKRFVQLALEGSPEAKEAFFELNDLVSSMALETNPQCVKYALSVLGKCKPIMRLPLLEPSQSNKRLIETAFQTVESVLQ